MLTDGTTWQTIAGLLSRPLVVADVGARGGVEKGWSQFSPHVKVYGFDPDDAECQRLNSDTQGIAKYIPVAIGASSGSHPFYITYDPFCSSLLRPIERLARERPRLAEMRLREVASVTTETIDELTRTGAIERVDHLKLDAQGAELAILEGAAGTLESICSVKLEVQFNQLYEGAPLFGEVDLFLRGRGFALWRLGELSHCSFADSAECSDVPEVLDYDSRRIEVMAGGGQLLWANAYYVREETADLCRPVAWEGSVRDACLAQAHHYTDLAEGSLRRALCVAPREAVSVLQVALDQIPTSGDAYQDGA